MPHPEGIIGGKSAGGHGDLPQVHQADLWPAERLWRWLAQLGEMQGFTRGGTELGAAAPRQDSHLAGSGVSRRVERKRSEGREARAQGSEAREARRCERGGGSEATGAMPEQAQRDGQKRRFPARAQG